jgi:hypothetical protein
MEKQQKSSTTPRKQSTTLHTHAAAGEFADFAFLHVPREPQREQKFIDGALGRVCDWLAKIKTVIWHKAASKENQTLQSIERLHMIMKLENSYESQETKNDEIYSSTRCLATKPEPNDGQEMNFSFAKDVRWHFDASRQIISIIFFGFDADKVEEMNHDIMKIDWFRSPMLSRCVWFGWRLRWFSVEVDKFDSGIGGKEKILVVCWWNLMTILWWFFTKFTTLSRLESQALKLHGWLHHFSLPPQSQAHNLCSRHSAHVHHRHIFHRWCRARNKTHLVGRREDRKCRFLIN